jgi:hypothetical protein
MKGINHFSNRTAFLVFLFFSTLFPLKAQVADFCNTSGGVNSVGIIPSNQASSSSTGPFYFRVYAYAIRRLDGSEGQTDQAIESAFDRLDNAFNPHNIYFVRQPCGCFRFVVDLDT